MTEAEFFDGYAEKWDSMELEDMPERIARVVALTGVQPGAAVLDVGTGTGIALNELSKAVGPTGVIYGIDVSTGMLRVAARKALPDNVRLILADATRPCFTEHVFDLVLCNAVFPHFEDGPRALRELAKRLRSKGRLAISHPIGREAVNRIHQDTGMPVQDDVVPTNNEMRRVMEDAGLVDVWILDEPEFHMAMGTRNSVQ